MRRVLLAVCLLIPLPVWAAALNCGSTSGHGTLGTVSSVTTLPNTINADGYAALYLEVVFPGGAATVEIDEKLLGGTNFIVVQGTSGSANAIFKITNPAGTYQGNVTVDGGANSVTVNYQCVKEL